MSAAQQTREFIDKLKASKLFTYDDIPMENKLAITIELSRLYKQGIIKKFSKGKFYKPKKSAFGELEPTYDEKIKSYMDKDSYETGINAYKRLGLTTQVANSITIATNKSYKKIKVGDITINFVPKRVDALKKDTKLLIILDALKDIKKIPDSSPEDTIVAIKKIITMLEKEKQLRLINYTKSYPPRVIAIIGAIFTEIGLKDDVIQLKQMLNPLTKFRLNLNDNVLIYKKEWEIS
jgi:hypothetical protein